jgi:DNA-binding NarL/FixJ family response regulator
VFQHGFAIQQIFTKLGSAYSSTQMTTLAIIAVSLVVLVLFFYLSDFRLEFRVNKTEPEKIPSTDKSGLDRLSNTELIILKMITEGKSNKEIAGELFISVHTVKKHISNIFKKLNLSSRTEARRYKGKITM